MPRLRSYVEDPRTLAGKLHAHARMAAAGNAEHGFVLTVGKEGELLFTRHGDAGELLDAFGKVIARLEAEEGGA